MYGSGSGRPVYSGSGRIRILLGLFLDIENIGTVCCHFQFDRIGNVLIIRIRNIGPQTMNYIDLLTKKLKLMVAIWWCLKYVLICRFTATLPNKGSRSRMSSLSEAFLREDYFSRETANSHSFTGCLKAKNVTLWIKSSWSSCTVFGIFRNWIREYDTIAFLALHHFIACHYEHSGNVTLLLWQTISISPKPREGLFSCLSTAWFESLLSLAPPPPPFPIPFTQPFCLL